MHDALAVGGSKRIGDVERDVDTRRGIHRPTGQPLLKRLAFEKLQRDERRIGADVINRADVGMAERRSRPRFPLEPRQRLGRHRDTGGQDLDRHHALEARVPGPVHFAHPASAEQRENLVGPEASAGSQGHELRLIVATERGAAKRGLFRSRSKASHRRRRRTSRVCFSACSACSAVKGFEQ